MTSPPRRSATARPVAEVVARAATPLLGRRGLAEESLLLHWSDIMGPMLAARVHPVRLARSRGDGGGVLHLLAESGAVALEVQHCAPQVIERVNAFLGRQAVARLSLRQGRPRTVRRRRRELPPLPVERRAVLDAALAAVEDPGLRQALDRLGVAIGRLQVARGG